MSSRGDAGYGDDDRLPWLESVDEDYSDGPSFWRIALLVLLALAVVGAALFGYYWYQQRERLHGSGQLIEAQEGDYKVEPDEPGGMPVEGEGDAVFAASEGDMPNASIAVGAEPEAPVAGTVAPRPTPAAEATGAARVTVPVPAPGEQSRAKTAPRTSGGAAVVQLGAFPDEQGAEGAWNRLSREHAFLASLGKSIERGESGGRTVYRLRLNAGSAEQARDICERLQAAGASCYIAN
ncbi:SPOR domain-containing protein [Sphingosinithalassobacter sp. LHW66-3]|uniref:SPOR domain-containing protein n=1 Tax=Sphingosinithalassobacter sp. LHW66-3 TaxID=3424718 RepID=UPI003D6C5068